jgi:hypothetical protein
MEILVNIQVPLASDVRELVDLHLLSKEIAADCGGRMLSSTGSETERSLFLFCPDDQIPLFERNITQAIRLRGFSVEIGYVPATVIKIAPVPAGMVSTSRAGP